MERIVIGGWPALLDEDARFARRWITDYLDQIVEVDIPSLGTTRRAPNRLFRALAALGRNVGQPIKLTDLAADIAGTDSQRPATETVTAYLDALHRLKLTDNSPSWQPHMRSRTRLREAPVRYFVDPSLGTAAIGIGSNDLLADLVTPITALGPKRESPTRAPNDLDRVDAVDRLTIETRRGKPGR